MTNITRSEIIDKIKSRNKKLSEPDIEEIINGILDAVEQQLVSGGRVEFRNFGIFDLKIRRAGKVRNPLTGNIMEVAEKQQPYFKAGKLLKQRINGLSNEKQ